MMIRMINTGLSIAMGTCAYKWFWYLMFDLNQAGGFRQAPRCDRTEGDCAICDCNSKRSKK